ncbi:MAG: phosphotransferase family protein [Pseudonocardiales bacterium]
MLTSDELAARTDRAVAAAAGAGRDLGLTVTDPRVLYDVFSVVVHLLPAPVVVRVPAVLPRTVAADPDAQSAQQRCELAVAGWLADRGHPVVAPSPLVAREPVRRDGFSMTFWQFVEQVPDADPCSRTAFEAAFPGADVQPIHGDAPYYNIIVTPEGKLCSDFEYVTLGPVERDLALADPQVQAAYDAAAVRLGLRPLDERLLRIMESAGMLQVVACLALVPQLPMLAEALRPLLELWRTTPLSGDLSDFIRRAAG